MTSSLPASPVEVAQLGRLELVARLLVEGIVMGRHRSPYKGTSVEFAEHREYFPGDEIRHIDWRAYGKTNRYYIKEFEDETNLTAHLLVDASGSMSYAGQSLRKFDYACILAATLAWLLLGQRDAVGLSVFDSTVRNQVRPSSSRVGFSHLVNILETTEPGLETSLADVVESILPSIRRRSLLILISDCLDSVDRLESALQRCRHARHDVVVFRIAAPEEIDFPFGGPTQFRSLEPGVQNVLVEPARLRTEYLRQYAEFTERLETICGNLLIDYVPLNTSEPIQDVLGSWLDRRMNLSGRR